MITPRNQEIQTGEYFQKLVLRAQYISYYRIDASLDRNDGTPLAIHGSRSRWSPPRVQIILVFSQLQWTVPGTDWDIISSDRMPITVHGPRLRWCPTRFDSVASNRPTALQYPKTSYIGRELHLNPLDHIISLQY